MRSEIEYVNISDSLVFILFVVPIKAVQVCFSQNLRQGLCFH